MSIDMREARERAAGIKLAEDAGAPKTAAVIADKDACYQDIFASAVDEVGHAAFVEALMRGPKKWAHMALNYMPNMGGHGQSVADAVAASAAPNAAQAGDSIGKYQLHQGAVVSGIARINETGDYRNLFKNNDYQFNPADQGIASGTTVRLYFGIEDDALIGLAAAPETFTFDPTSPSIAYYTSWGTAGAQQFQLVSVALESL